MADTNGQPNASPPTEDDAQLRRRRFLAVGLMVVAALFAGAVIGLLAATRGSEWNLTPPESRKLEALRGQMEKGDLRPELRDAVRQEDLRLRRSYFTCQRRLYTGAYLLIVAGVSLIVCARWYASLDPATVMPRPRAERNDVDRCLAVRKRRLAAAAATAGAVGLALVVFGFLGGAALPSQQPVDVPAAKAPRKAKAPQSPASKPEAKAPDRNPQPHGFKENWPAFRGPNGMGTVEAGNWPQKWDGKTGQNVLWKTEVPGKGKNSPVLWGNRVFLTSGDKNKRDVLCFERSNGKLLWQSEVKPAAKEGAGDEDDAEVPEDTGYAAPTAATDGERVYATFATADVAALDFDGNVLWVRNFGPADNVYGMASSLAVFKDRVVFQLDRGVGADEEKSALLVLDGKTGKTVWRTPRPVTASWASPILAHTPAGPRIFAAGNPWVMAYEPDFGTELWQAGGLTGDVAPSPVYADGKVFATNEYAKVMAIRDDGSGDVTETHVEWTAEEGMSDASTPVCDGRLFLQAHSSGLLTCYDAKTGELLWQKELGSSLLITSDVLDWAKLCAQLSEAEGQQAPSPYGRIWELLSPDLRSMVMLGQQPGGPDKAKQTEIVEALNGIVKKRDFYRPADFQNVALPEAAQKLLNKSKEDISYSDSQKLNRLLLEAAYPQTIAKCRESAETVWASLTLAGDVVYLPCESGRMYLLKLARHYRLLGMADLGEKMYASPAFADSRIYIRGHKHLFCIANPKP